MTGADQREIYARVLLSTGAGAGANLNEALRFYGSARAFLEAGRREWLLSGLVGRTLADRIASVDERTVEGIIETCVKKGYGILIPGDGRFPDRLAEIPRAPLLLYARGGADALNSGVPVAFVGTRQASAYSLTVARRLAYGCAKAGALIVSGGALGVDSSSHNGALAAGGKTVAFLGCGFDCDYLRENRDLRSRIAAHGALLSEYPPAYPASRSTFPIRNRLISGVSLGVVVIEAGERSGSLITARCAMEQGRDVFAVPGDVTLSSFTGCNRLIRDGASPVFGVEDVMGRYAALLPEEVDLSGAVPLSQEPEALRSRGAEERPAAGNNEKPVSKSGIPEKPEKPEKRERREKPPLPGGLSPDAADVFGRLGGEPLSADELSMLCGKPASVILPALTELELFGLIADTGGGRFVLA